MGQGDVGRSDVGLDGVDRNNVGHSDVERSDVRRVTWQLTDEDRISDRAITPDDDSVTTTACT